MTHISDPHFAERVPTRFDKQSAVRLAKTNMPTVAPGMEDYLQADQGNAPRKVVVLN